MKRILNKILCKMWGCQTERIYRIDLPFENYIGGGVIVVPDCIHCGAPKHD